MFDQTGHKIILKKPVKRIVSLVPSQTELLSYLGLDSEVIGISKFCIHPKSWFRQKKRIGGTKNVDINLIKSLKPDLIIANKEENSKDDILQLRVDYPLYTSDIATVEDALQMISDIGDLIDKNEAAATLIGKLQSDFSNLPHINGTVLYLIWKDPFMAAGIDTFINSMLSSIGLFNIHQSNKRYNEISVEEMRRLNPDFLLLSSEPYPFTEKHVSELQKKIDVKIILVDGEMFSWYGSRMTHFSSYVKKELCLSLKT